MKRAASFFIWTAITVFCVFVALCFFPFFNISEIEVNGIESLTQEQVISICSLDESRNLIAFNTFKAANELKKNNYVEDVSFDKQLPQKLVINITEHKVRGYIPYMNSYLYIDEDGRVLDSRPEMTKQLPIVVGLQFDGFTMGELLNTDNPDAYKAVEELSKLFSKYDLLDAVIQVDVSDVENIHLHVDKVDVLFGDFDDANGKMGTLSEILKQLDTSVAGVLDLTAATPTFKYMS